MYNYLKGLLTTKSALHITVECAGIGFDVQVPLSTFDKLPSLGSDIKILTHYSINENEVRMFGFLTEKEREVFRMLIGISRIGPKIALSILSGISVNDLISAINTNNDKLIATVPGLGKKSAQRLIIELKDKVTAFISKSDELNLSVASSNWSDDAEAALLTLGYKNIEIRKVLASLTKAKTYTSSEELIKHAIKELYKKNNMVDIRSEAYKIIVKVLKNNKFSDRLLQQMSKKIQNLGGSSDLLYSLVKGVIKMQKNLEYVASQYTDPVKFAKTDLKIKTLLYIAFYQLLYMDSIPDHAAVNETVNTAKKILNSKVGDFINAVLRQYLRQPKIEYPTDPVLQMANEYSFPEELISTWLKEWGTEDTEMLCMYFNDIPDLTIRVNSLETNSNKVINYFKNKEVHLMQTDASNFILKSKDVKQILTDVAFSEGYYSVQDASAALVVELMNPQKEQSILDLFAAPGGKATFIAELMNNTGELIANDKIPNKVKLMKQAISRLKITNMKTISGDAFSYGPIAPAFDNVLLDVPCSGWGVFQKKAELRWQLNQDIPKLLKIQESALVKGAQFVKFGGHLVYSTCTLNREENEKQVEKFLKKNKEFTLVDASTIIPVKYVNNKYLKTIPHRHHMDGAFAAKMVRNKL